MKSLRLLSVVMAGMTVAAQAAVVTRNPLDYPVGADVSTAWPGVRLTLLSTGVGTTYAPNMSPAIVGTCNYGACPVSSPLNNVAGSLSYLSRYQTCYNQTRAGFWSSDCTRYFRVLEAVFSNPTDFVEFNTAWNMDAPGIIAYDAAGNEIQSCMPGFPVGATTGCLTSIEYSPGTHIGVIRVATSSPVIARVVIGSPWGNAEALSMQYTMKPKSCNPREPFEKELPSPAEQDAGR